MLKVSTDILALTSEALVLARAGKIAFANAAARGILGENCVGGKLNAFFPADIIGAQAQSFIADAAILGKRYIVRVSRQEDVRVMFISRPAEEPVMLNDALLYSMRSTLMTMSVSMELIRARAEVTKDDALWEGVETLYQGYYRMTRLSSNLAAVKNILAGELCYSPTLVDLRLMCGSLLERVRIYKPKPELSFYAPDSLPVMLDTHLVEHMLVELLSNCYIHAKGCTHISVAVTDSAESVIISVSDDGCGISGEELHSVFNRYVSPFETAGMSGGTGLGLTVARGIAERHGGALLLESRPGYGTTVRVSLKKTPAPVKLCACEEEYECDSKEVLIGLSDCLPQTCYGENFLD